MAEALGAAASVIAIAGLAYSSSKLLYEVISEIQDAPKVLLDLNQDIDSLNQILVSLKSNLDSNDSKLSKSQIACLQKATPTLQACEQTCKDFKTKIDG